MHDLYHASAQEMEALDKIAVDSGLEIRQMMELAGFHMLEVFNSEDINRGQSVVVVSGRGNKSGDGLSAARHLCNHGYDVSVVLADENLKPNPEHHRKLLETIGVPIQTTKDNWRESVKSADVIMDALIGYHLEGSPRGSYAEMINLVNDTSAMVIAYDLPTGVDATTGKAYQPHITADITLSLALPKLLFTTKQGRQLSGKIYLADIGISDQMYRHIGADTPFKTRQPVILL